MWHRRKVLENLGVLSLGMWFSRARIAAGFESFTPSPRAGDPEAVARDERFWSRIQAAYDVDRSLINLNNGGVCPAPRTVITALKRGIDYSNAAPAYTMWRHLEPLVESVRTGLAQTLGCDREEVAVTRNTSESLEIVQFGIDLQPGDEVVTTDQDYPRMVRTWLQRERREGIRLRRVSFPVPLLDKDDFVHRVLETVNERTRVIHICHIINITGQILPVRPICDFARRRGIFTIVDGAHSFAHFPFRIGDLRCDAFGTSLHKWLSAPIGTGMLYVRREKIPEIWPLMAAPEEMDDNIRKFEEIGTHPAAVHNAVSEALAFYHAVGPENKAARLRYLHHRWADRIRELPGVRFLTDLDDETAWCGILVVDIEGVDPAKLAAYLLEKHRIIVTPIHHPQFRGIRVTPNVYTTTREIDRFGDVMEAIARRKITV